MAVPASLGFNHNRVYGLDELKDQVFILTEQFDTLADGLIEACRRVGFEPKIKIAHDFETAILWVSMGEGITGVVRDHYTGGLSNIDLIRTSNTTGMNFSIVWKKNTTNPVVGAFCASMACLE